MLIQVAGAQTWAPAPNQVSDECLAKAFEMTYGLTPAEAREFFRGYQALTQNLKVKQPVAIPDEHGKPQWAFVLYEDSIERIVEHWCRTVPGIARKFSQQLHELKTAFYDPEGFTKACLAKLKTEVPSSLYFMLKALDEYFWDDQDSIQKFLELYPEFEMKQ